MTAPLSVTSHAQIEVNDSCNCRCFPDIFKKKQHHHHAKTHAVAVKIIRVPVEPAQLSLPPQV